MIVQQRKKEIGKRYGDGQKNMLMRVRKKETSLVADNPKKLKIRLKHCATTTYLREWSTQLRDSASHWAM